MLRDPHVRLHEVEISVLTPFRPMLGDRGTPNKVPKPIRPQPGGRVCSQVFIRTAE